MSGNLLVRFDEGRVGRASLSPSLLLYLVNKESCAGHHFRQLTPRPADQMRLRQADFVEIGHININYML